MNQAFAIDAIEERLRALIAEPDLQSATREQAERFLSRLSSPVRVTLFGRPALAKAKLADHTAGEQLIPDGQPRPTIELRYGMESSAQITHSDGSVTVHDGVAEAADFSDAILVVFESPSPLLKRISILEAAANQSEADQRAAIDWAAARTDIALWFSAKYDESDQRIWTKVPERIQDHAYLVLTDSAPQEAAAIKSAHRGEFHDVYAIAPDAPEHETGIGALVDRLIAHAEMGREADADSALLFLRSQDALSAKSTPRKSSPAPAAGREPVAQEAASAPATAPKTPEPVESKPNPMREVYAKGLRYIRQRSENMLTELQRDAIAPGDVASECSDTLVHLSDLLNASDDGSADEMAELTDTVLEAESLVVLMENEKSAQAAADAVAILLQVRHDFETCLAA